jgi:hypothetical protein
MADIKYLISVDATGATTSIKQFDETVDGLAKQSDKAGKSHDGLIGSIFKGVTVANLATKGINFLQGELGSFITEAVEAEKVNRIFNSTLSRHGESVSVVGDIYDRFASQMQAVTGESDETIKSLVGLAYNLGVNKEKIRDAVQGAVGLTTAYGGSLQSNLEAVARAYQGNWRQIDQLIPEIRNLSDESDKLALLQEKMADGFDASKSAMTGFGGELKTAANQWGDFKEAAGTAFLSVFSGIKKLTDSLTGHNAILRKLKAEQDAYNWAMDEAKKTHKTYVDILDDEARAEMKNADILEYINKAFDKNGKLIKTAEKATKSFTGETKKAEKAEDKFTKEVIAAIPQARNLSAALGNVIPPLNGVGDSFDKVAKKTSLWEKLSNDSVLHWSQSTIDTFNQVMAATQDITSQIGGLFQALADRKKSILDKEYEQQRYAIEQSELSEEEKFIRLSQLEEEYNAKADAIRISAGKKQKKIQYAMAVMDAAGAIVNALNTHPFIPAGLIAAATAAVMGGVQVATIASTPLAKGAIFKQPTLLGGANGGSYQVAEPGSGGVEIVATPENIRKAIGLDRQRGGGGGGTIIIQNRIFLDGKEMKGWMAKVIEETSRIGKLKVAGKAIVGSA